MAVWPTSSSRQEWRDRRENEKRKLFSLFFARGKKNSFFFFSSLDRGCFFGHSRVTRLSRQRFNVIPQKKENQIISAPSVKGVAIFSIASIKGPSKRVNEILDDVCGRAKVFCRYQNANLIDFGLFWQRRGHVNKKNKIWHLKKSNSEEWCFNLTRRSVISVHVT